MEATTIKLEPKHHGVLKLVMLFVGILAIGAVVVVADKSGTDQMTAVTPDASSGLTVGSEMINGISVPPEPDPTINNATLAGVDSNQNGVRDDVERVIAGASKKATYDAYTLPIATLLNRLATTQLPTPESIVDIERNIYCLDRGRTYNEKLTLDVEIIRELTNNTPARVATWNGNDTLTTTKPWLFEGGFSCN